MREHAMLPRSGVYRLAVPATLAERPLAIQFLVGICRAHALCTDVEHALVSAFGEAFNNVVEHGYKRGGGDLFIEVELRRERVVVRLRDRGAGFDPHAVRAPVLDELPERGLGLFIILRAMDEVSWYRDGDENVLVLVKRVPRPRQTT